MTGREIICTKCGFVGWPKRTSRGSRLTERFIWLVFFFPGIFYSLWRSAGKGIVCPKCGSKALVPFDSSEGELALREHLDKRK